MQVTAFSNSDINIEQCGEKYITINEEIIKDDLSVIYIEDKLHIELKTILSVIDNSVVVNSNDENIQFKHNEKKYICVFDEAYFLFNGMRICEIEKYGSINDDDYIRMNPWSSMGCYEIMNGDIYLYYDHAIRLCEYFGYDLKIYNSYIPEDINSIEISFLNSGNNNNASDNLKDVCLNSFKYKTSKKEDIIYIIHYLNSFKYNYIEQEFKTADINEQLSIKSEKIMTKSKK